MRMAWLPRSSGPCPSCFHCRRAVHPALANPSSQQLQPARRLHGLPASNHTAARAKAQAAPLRHAAARDGAADAASARPGPRFDSRDPVPRSNSARPDRDPVPSFDLAGSRSSVQLDSPAARSHSVPGELRVLLLPESAQAICWQICFALRHGDMGPHRRQARQSPGRDGCSGSAQAAGSRHYPRAVASEVAHFAQHQRRRGHRAGSAGRGARAVPALRPRAEQGGARDWGGRPGEPQIIRHRRLQGRGRGCRRRGCEAAGPGRRPASAPRDPNEAAVVEQMRKNGWSRKEAVKFIDEGGLEMEEMRKEMDHPMDAIFEEAKKNGPPKWFRDMMEEKEQKDREEAAAAALAAGAAAPELPDPPAAPSALGPA
ncbi:unnamed protein product [Prorocentrum cordatum]|uniref:UBA domain-containing protein n=1 Tax=Prorocentrum cordatum TaxID=2364126 RepID=A0ABN9T9L3_9DINO|nr:unnamed protein product [Polarella glacialis]